MEAKDSENAQPEMQKFDLCLLGYGGGVDISGPAYHAMALSP